MKLIALCRDLSSAVAHSTMIDGEQGSMGFGWLDKSASPVAIQAPDRACLSPCRSVGSRAAPRHMIHYFNDVFGTVRHLLHFGSRQ